MMQNTLKRLTHLAVASAFVLSPNASGITYASNADTKGRADAKQGQRSPSSNWQKSQPGVVIQEPAKGATYYFTGDPPVFKWQGSNLGRLFLHMKWGMRPRKHHHALLPATPPYYRVPADVWSRVSGSKEAIEIDYWALALKSNEKAPAPLNDGDPTDDKRWVKGSFSIIPDKEPPKVILSNPIGQKVTRFANQQVTGTVTDNANSVNQVSLLVNGNLVSAPVVNGKFSVPIKLTEGENKIAVSAKDRAGNTGRSEFSLALDSIAPTLAFTAPTKRLSNQPSHTVVGKVSDNRTKIQSITFKLNGKASALPVAESGEFAQAVSLLEGKNAIEAVVTDEAGNTARAELPLVLDTVAPTIAVSSPTKLISNKIEQILSGSVGDNVSQIRTIGFKLKDEQKTLTLADGGTFTQALTLGEGKNLLELQVADEAGNVARKELSLVLDTVAPTLSFSAPTKRITNQLLHTVIGTASDNHSKIAQAAFKFNGVASSVQVAEGGQFSRDINLVEGQNHVEVTIADEAGNEARGDFMMVLDTVPPSLSLLSPASQFLTNQPNVSIKGEAKDNHSLIDNVALYFGNLVESIPVLSNAFTFDGQVMEGDNTVKVSATDEAGNTATMESLIILDTVPPVVTIESPVNGFTSTAKVVQVQGSIEDNRQLIKAAALSVNGIVLPIEIVAAGSFSVSATLKPGLNELILKATDVAGNTTSSESWKLTYQAEPVMVGNTAIVGKVLVFGTKAPIAGAIITTNTGYSTSTDEKGEYFLLTPSGEHLIHIEHASYTPSDRSATGVQDQLVSVQTAYLTPRDTKTTLIKATTGGTVVNTGGSAELVVPPGALESDQAISITIQDTMEDAKSLPGPLPDGAVPVSFADLQPDGLKFKKFVTLRLPNPKKLKPGTPVPCAYWDEEKHVWAGVGGGAVSSDGKFLDIPINHFTSYGFSAPPPSGPPPAPSSEVNYSGFASGAGGPGGGPAPVGVCLPGSRIDVTTGNLSIDYKLKGLPSFGLETSPALTYNSKTRIPSKLLKYRLSLPSGSGYNSYFYRRVDWELSVAGKVYEGTGQVVEVDWDTRDARGLFVEPGEYPVIIRLSSTSQDGGITNSVLEFKTVVTGPGSRYGVGWNFNYDMRLVHLPPTYQTYDGYYYVSMPDGRTATFTERFNHGSGSYVIQSEPGTFDRLVKTQVNGQSGFALIEKDQTRHLFDSKGRLLSSIDRSGNTRTIGYSDNLITSITDSASQATNLAYDAQGKLRSITDAKGRAYTFAIDSNGFLTTITDPLQHSVRYAYSESGHLASRTDERSDTTQYVTRFDGSLTKRIAPDGSARTYSLSRDMRVTAAKGYLSKNVVPDGLGNLVYTSSVHEQTIGLEYLFKRYLNIIDKATGKKQSIELGSFTIPVEQGSRDPKATQVEPWLGAVAVDSSRGEAYVALPGDGIRVVDLEGLKIEASFPYANLKASDVHYDKSKRTLWVNDESVLRFDFSAESFTEYDGAFLANVAELPATFKPTKDAALDPQGNLWKVLYQKNGTNDDGFWLVRLNSNGNLLNKRMLDFGWGISFLQRAADGRIWYLSNELNGLGQRLCSVDPQVGSETEHPELVAALQERYRSVNGYYPDRLSITRLLVEPGGQVWVNEQFAGTGWCLIDLKTGKLESYKGVVENYVSFDYFTMTGYEANFRPFVDEEGLIWLAGNNFLFGIGNSHEPSIGTYTDSNGHVTKYGLTPDANPWAKEGAFRRHTYTVNAMHATTSIEVDSNMLPRKITNENGFSTQMAYDTLGNLGYREEDFSLYKNWRYLSWSYLYHPVFNFVTEATDPLWRRTTWAYDSKGNLSKLSMPEGRTFEYGYFDNGLIKTVKDPRGNVTQYSYNPVGKVSMVSRPDGKSIRYEYDDYGNPAQITDANGNVVRFAYDALNRKISETFVMDDGSDQTTAYSYEEGPDCGCLGDLDQVASITDAKGRVTLFHYDSNHNLKKVEHPDGSALQWAYDGEGNLLSQTDALGKQTSYTYDAANRRVSETDPLGRTSLFEYDRVGNRTAVVDPKGNRTAYSFDAINRLTSVTDAKGGKTEFDYDHLSNVVSIKDARGKVTNRTFDALNQLRTETNPLGRTTLYSYDPAGNLTDRTDPKGQLTKFEYDSLNRLKRQVMPDDTFEYAYDSMGNLLSARNKNGQQQFEYDARNRVLKKNEVESGRTLRYTYDEVDNLSSLTDAEGKVTRYRYDKLNRIEGLTFDPTGKNLAFGFEYDAMGRRMKLSRPNGVITSYAYGDAGQLLAIASQREADNQVLQSVAYTYDDNGNRVTRTDERGMVSYAYDETDQLIEEVRPEGTTSWQYDLVGNRLNESGAGAANYIHDDANRLTSRSDGTVYDYDPNGNTLSEIRGGISTRYGYNANNQLEQVEREGRTWQYRYDALGNRSQIVDQVKALRILNDGLDRLSEYDVSGKLVARNVFAGLDEPLARIDDQGNVSYYLADGLGSISGLHDGQGSLTDSYTYDAWGANIGRTGETVQPFTFTGREDDGTGLFAFRARYYAATIGRFTQLDPLGFRGGDVNLYRYVLNRTTVATDPLGLFPVEGYDPDVPRMPIHSGVSRAGGLGVPNSIYVQVDPNGGRAIQSTVYDRNGRAIGQVDWKQHGKAGPGHGHIMTEPGRIGSGHGQGSQHVPFEKVPQNWTTLPSGVAPHTPTGGGSNSGSGFGGGGTPFNQKPNKCP
ncbi:tRNA3(Ser)-specific nuclease WapA precursor [compost metagenome]